MYTTSQNTCGNLRRYVLSAPQAAAAQNGDYASNRIIIFVHIGVETDYEWSTREYENI